MKSIKIISMSKFQKRFIEIQEFMHLSPTEETLKKLKEIVNSPIERRPYTFRGRKTPATVIQPTAK